MIQGLFEQVRALSSTLLSAGVAANIGTSLTPVGVEQATNLFFPGANYATFDPLLQCRTTTFHVYGDEYVGVNPPLVHLKPKIPQSYLERRKTSKWTHDSKIAAGTRGIQNYIDSRLSTALSDIKEPADRVIWYLKNGNLDAARMLIDRVKIDSPDSFSALELAAYTEFLITNVSQFSEVQVGERTCQYVLQKLHLEALGLWHTVLGSIFHSKERSDTDVQFALAMLMLHGSHSASWGSAADAALESAKIYAKQNNPAETGKMLLLGAYWGTLNYIKDGSSDFYQFEKTYQAILELEDAWTQIYQPNAAGQADASESLDRSTEGVRVSQVVLAKLAEAKRAAEAIRFELGKERARSLLGHSRPIDTAALRSYPIYKKLLNEFVEYTKQLNEEIIASTDNREGLGKTSADIAIVLSITHQAQVTSENYAEWLAWYEKEQKLTELQQKIKNLLNVDTNTPT